MPARSIARVYLIDIPRAANALYDYFIPDHLRDDVLPGRFVVLPFGGVNKREAALVTELADKTDVPSNKLKSITAVLPNAVSLNDEMLGLCLFMSEHTFCTVGEAVHTIIPAPAMTKITESYKALKLPEDTLTEEELAAYRFIEKRDSVTSAKLKERFGVSAGKLIRGLISSGAVKEIVEYSDGDGGKYTDLYSLTIPKEQAGQYIDGDKKLRGAKMREVMRLLAINGEMSFEELKTQLSVAKPTITALIRHGLVKAQRIAVFRDPYAGEITPPADQNELNSEQEAAAESLKTLLSEREPRAALLFGITGSGKTRVIKRLADFVLERGESVIILVPEIGLTPQSVMFFRSYYGSRVVVIHSGLSAGERFDAWNRMRRGEADVCIGTRSAVFAPFANIGMIVIDEEQEHTYKSDSQPRYHARDIARYRCASHNALMLLASATPSVESRRKAETNVYSFMRLNERWGGAVLPETIIYDTRDDAADGYTGPIGKRLRGEIEKNLSLGEQTILLLNRRGYNSFLRCPMCGYVKMCTECSVSLTYHTSGLSRGLLCCHYCGHREPPPTGCPQCGGKHMTYQGYGTQRAEEELCGFFPGATIMRMDADTTSAKFSVDDMLARFRAGEADILLGTQMVAKGHDFPKVSLVGVLSADNSLFHDDYRANERTFALLTQVIGRAGRADTGGRAVIQTFSPNHPVLHMAAAQDYDEFYRNEIALRQALVFPPFCDIAAVTVTSESESAASEAAVSCFGVLHKALTDGSAGQKMIIFGPFEAPLYKFNGKFRMRIIIKCRVNSRLRRLFRELDTALPTSLRRKASITIDINPTNI